MSAPVYLDWAATTPVHPQVAAAMAACLAEPSGWANPSSVHAAGRAARARVEAARAEVAALIGAVPEAVVFTSGATESDNLAVLGAARGQADRGRHVVTSRTEHRAVLDACAALAAEGFEVTRLVPGPDGRVTPAQVAAALRPDTILVSLMHANNETGVLQDVAGVAAVTRPRGVLLHVDAAQSAGKVPVDVAVLGADLLSLTAHKLQGPKGIGALWVRREPRPTLVPLLFGGGQEGGLRPGTLPVHQIVGFGAACRLARESLAAAIPAQAALRDALWQELAAVGGVWRNGAGPSLPGVLNLGFLGIEGESLLLALDGEVACSSGSACSSASAEPSYVLRALGRHDLQAQASLRLSLGPGTRADEVARAAAAIVAAVARLRALAPPAALVAFPAPSDLVPGAVPPPLPAAWPPLAAGSAWTAAARGAYEPAVLELFAGLPGSGPLPADAGDCWVGESGDLAAGAWVRLEALVRDGQVTAARWQAWGCPHTLAAAARVATTLPGRPPAAAAGIAAARPLAQALGVPARKLGRLLKVEEAAAALAPACTVAGTR